MKQNFVNQGVSYKALVSEELMKGKQVDYKKFSLLKNHLLGIRKSQKFSV